MLRILGLQEDGLQDQRCGLVPQLGESPPIFVWAMHRHLSAGRYSASLNVGSAHSYAPHLSFTPSGPRLPGVCLSRQVSLPKSLQIKAASDTMQTGLVTLFTQGQLTTNECCIDTGAMRLFDVAFVAPPINDPGNPRTIVNRHSPFQVLSSASGMLMAINVAILPRLS